MSNLDRDTVESFGDEWTRKNFLTRRNQSGQIVYEVTEPAARVLAFLDSLSSERSTLNGSRLGTLLGDVVPYDRVWRTGANAATQFTTSAPITLAGMPLAAGSYTLWTIPRARGSELIVNRQTGQWGTSYDAARDLGRAMMATDTLATPVDEFTISIDSTGAKRGTLTMVWGSFRWRAPIEVR